MLPTHLCLGVPRLNAYYTRILVLQIYSIFYHGVAFVLVKISMTTIINITLTAKVGTNFVDKW
jgi:hypothetical protein